MNYYHKPDSYGKNKIKVALYLSYFATKFDVKKATGVDTSEVAKKADLASQRSDIDNLDVDKLKAAPVDLSKRSDVAKYDVKILHMINW